ncbi:TMV resistance protein N-like [Prosopis cineraria]|uniref:TMV resistance protein N-like n=1 Tax=Prosopis cineraria TaxID=364024 RepID=UPI00241066A7|nr:TMV resistance protein N-like [Prosopis cineraria]
MISKIIGVDIRIQDANEGVEAIRMRLKQKKILLILDNVDKHEHLEKLVGDFNWFSGGSRTIIMTWNKQLLERHGIKHIYDIKALDDEESLELLNWNAFRSNQVNPSNIMVLNPAVNYAKGLPLALEVIGSNMYGRNINECESALDAFKLIPSKDIQQVLKVSYDDDLGHFEKEIFLVIACFFKGESLGHIKYMVEAIYGFNNPSYFIGVLEDKCLINIEDSCIEMQGLIQDMGREIVHQESPNEPGKHSRLWFHEDIVHVLEDHTLMNSKTILPRHLVYCAAKLRHASSHLFALLK